VTPKRDQYARKAEGWTDAEYADARAYLDHRAELIATLGAPLRAGDEVLDLACGDGGLGEHLLARALAYTGIDAEPAMVDAARRRLGDRATIGVGDLNSFVPERPVAATTVFRAIYYVHDRAAFFARASRFTERKLVFDLNPRQYAVDLVVAEREGRTAPQDDVHLFVTVPLGVLLDHALARLLGGVRVRAERGDPEAAPHRTPHELAAVDR